MDVLGIGSEIVECLRIARMIERHGEQFVNRVFTPAEVAYCQKRKQATQHFAARWAAKQAVLKALGARWQRANVWLDIEISSDWRGKVTVDVRGTLRDLMAKQCVRKIVVSMSHCRTHACAFAMAQGGGKVELDKDK